MATYTKLQILGMGWELGKRKGEGVRQGEEKEAEERERNRRA